jgi:hypothetical protein
MNHHDRQAPSSADGRPPLKPLRKPLFPLGKLVATREAIAAMARAGDDPVTPQSARKGSRNKAGGAGASARK